MKRILSALVLSLIVFSSCTTTTSSNTVISSNIGNSKPTSLSTQAVEINGMSDEKILEIFKEDVDKTNDFYQWLRYYSGQDLDPTLEKIYETNETYPEGFYWLPVTRFKTKQELYDYGKTFQEEELLNFTTLDRLFPDRPTGFGGNGDEEDGSWYPVTNYDYNEIDGRLYVRDAYINEEFENQKIIDKDLTTAQVIAQRDGEILIATSLGVNSLTKEEFYTYFVLLLQNGNWVLNGTGGIGIPNGWEAEVASMSESYTTTG